VITQDDIRRSGANNIPDLPRMVPGVNVAQISSNIGAISLRGFDGESSNKLLVMLDGRIVQLPTFSGTFWSVLDVPLEDVERIEVIRGPGGATWGANAVDGVINIITSEASESRGGMFLAGAGNLDQGFGTLQYGGTAGKNTDYRVFARKILTRFWISLLVGARRSLNEYACMWLDGLGFLVRRGGKVRFGSGGAGEYFLRASVALVL